MGRDVAEAVPEAMAVFDRGSDGVRARPEAAVLRLAARGRWSRRRCSSRRSSRRASRCWPPCARAVYRARLRDRPFGRRVRRARSGRVASGVDETIALVRERGLAMAEAAKERPGSMAAILGLDDEVVERLCRRILGVWPANYNCPGQIVVSGENDAVDELCAQAEQEGARRTVKLEGLGRVPLPARRACGRAAAPGDRGGQVRRAAGGVHVHRHRPVRGGAADGRAARRPADCAGAVHAGGLRARQGRREDVRRGRAGQRPLRADEADRPQREGGLGERPRLAGEGQGGSLQTA